MYDFINESGILFASIERLIPALFMSTSIPPGNKSPTLFAAVYSSCINQLPKKFTWIESDKLTSSLTRVRFLFSIIERQESDGFLAQAITKFFEFLSS